MSQLVQLLQLPHWSGLAAAVLWVQRGLGLALTTIALVAARDLPRWSDELFLAASLYLLLLIKLPRLWIVLLPMFCVTVDLAPWTGRFLYNELDVFFWLTIAAALICARYRVPSLVDFSREQTLGLSLLTAFIALAVMGSSGLGAIVDPPGASFISPYLASAYGYAVVKGLIWAALLLPLWREFRRSDPELTLRLLFVGSALAAFGLFSVVLWERGTVAAWDLGLGSAWSSFSNLATSYRTIGLFSNMRTGGEALDGTIILLLAICAYGGLYAKPRVLVWVCRFAVLALAYVTLVGFTRATYAAFILTLDVALAMELYRGRVALRIGMIDVVLISALLPLCFTALYLQTLLGTALGLLPVCAAAAVILLAVGRFRLRWSLRRSLSPAVAMLGLSLLFAVGLTTDTMGGRMHSVNRDLDTRLDHWRNVVFVARQSPGHTLFGAGAGTFPALYREYFPAKVAWVGDAEIDRQSAILRLGGTGDLLFAQRLNLSSPELRLALLARGLDGGRLSVGLCARNVLDTGWRGGRCDTQLVEFLPGRDFSRTTLTLVLPAEARQGEAANWPIALQFRALDAGRLIEINDVSDIAGLATPIRNPAFYRGMDSWFFSTDFGHLPFHVKNVWLQFWFDQGWVGVIVMLAMVCLVTWRGLQAHPHEVFTPLAATAVIGLGAVGMFGTPLDAARVSWLFYLLLFAALLEPLRSAPALPIKEPA